jgi:hypothetical protein
MRLDFASSRPLLNFKISSVLITASIAVHFLLTLFCDAKPEARESTMLVKFFIGFLQISSASFVTASGPRTSSVSWILANSVLNNLKSSGIDSNSFGASLIELKRAQLYRLRSGTCFREMGSSAYSLLTPAPS